MNPLYAINGPMLLFTNVSVILLCYRDSVMHSRRGAIIVAGMVALSVVSFTIHARMPFDYQIIFTSSIFLLPYCFLVRGPFGCKLFLFYSQTVTVNLLMMIASYIAELFAEYNSTMHVYIQLSLTALSFLALILLAARYGKLACARLIEGVVSRGLWLCFAALPLSAFIVLKLIYFPTRNIAPLPIVIDPYFLLLPVFLTVGFALLAVSIITMNGRAMAIMELNLARSIVRSGREHYEQLTAMSEQVRTLRHDGRHALVAAQQLLQQGDTDGAQQLLTKLSGEYVDTGLVEYCASRVINAYLNSFRERCARAEVQFEAQLQLSGCQFDDYELCVVLGNLLENALTATTALAPSERRISLTIKLQGEQLGILVENTMLDKPNILNGEFISSKPQGGLGIKSIKTITQRYSGGYYPEWEDGVFRAYVALCLRDAAS